MTSHSPDSAATDSKRRLREGCFPRDFDAGSFRPHPIKHMGRKSPWLMNLQAEGFFRRRLQNTFGIPFGADSHWEKDR